jgi:hypothetical protein
MITIEAGASIMESFVRLAALAPELAGTVTILAGAGLAVAAFARHSFRRRYIACKQGD